VTLDEQDQRLLRLAIELSREARAHGNHPFGAILADEAGTVLLEAENSVVTSGDVTGHAETNLIRAASSTLPREVLARATLYASTEPCAMCAGAIYWCGVGRLVYAMAETDLLALTGEHPGNPTLDLSCRLVLGSGQRSVDIVGPALADEALAVHAGFWEGSESRGPGEPSEYARALGVAFGLASRYVHELPGRHVGPGADSVEIMAALGDDLADEGTAADAVIRQMAQAVEPGLVASSGPRYFGFVFGGALPASIGADWLAAAWDQNAVLHASSPAAAAAEQVAGAWLLDLLGLPPEAGFGLVGGAGLANVVALAAARHAVLAREGWDVETRGLYGAPEVSVCVSDEAHATLETALQYLGLGRERVFRVPTDAQGRMRADACLDIIDDLADPLIVCSQAGNVNSGAVDPILRIADALAPRANAWHHVDGAFGLWAAASPRHRHLVAGAERADSWATDAHKWLNVGYDCGFVAVRDREAQRAAMSTRAAYLVHDEWRRDGWDWVLDSSRRARGFALYATLRSLGRHGVRDLVEGCCALAARMATRLAEAPGVEVLNDVVLNQVLVRFDPDGGGDRDAHTRAVIERVQADGTAWLGGTTWHGMAAMRISVSNWSTTEADADATVEAILHAHALA
jgi:glutamate/tyrosine decarboxylase-like PLP-dependent enzyme/tRNA(Arg) A34 adenosine deaminase TadA